MKNSWREYFKVILKNVYFDKKLFRKEYKKSLHLLPAQDASELKTWLRREVMNSNRLK